MNTVHVVEVGAVTALGQTPEALWNGLVSGRTGLAPVRRFPTDRYPCHVACCVPALDAEHPRSRLDALVERLLDPGPAVLEDTVLLTASTKAGIDQLERSVRGQDTDLDRVLGHQVADRVASLLGLRGPRSNIGAACASATVALALGASRIRQGEAESVLVCGLDLVSEFVFSGFSALLALSATGCRPFDVDRDGLILGEGAAYLLLMSERRMRQTGRPSLGCIAGWGIAADAHHITAPSRDGEGLVRAVRQALHQAGVEPADLAAVNAHGTGSVYNDAMELTALETLFSRIPPVHSVKGATGHTMGACGAIEAIVGLLSLRHQQIPPTVGLSTPEERAAQSVSASAQGICGRYLLTTNSGFGGINAALVLQRSGPS